MLLSLSPFLLSIVALVLFRQSALRAGLVGLAGVAAIILTQAQFRMDIASASQSVSVGAFNTFNIALVLFGGVLLYRVLEYGGALEDIADRIVQLIQDPIHRLFAFVFGASVFFESATGFGVGIVVVAPLFVALGFTPLRAAVLSLLGQCAVPWGALSVGTVLGADIAGVSEVKLGTLSALYSLPVCLLFGLAALKIADLISIRAVGIGAGYAVALSLLLGVFSFVVGVELAGCAAGLSVLVIAVVVTGVGQTAAQRLLCKAFLPFGVLILTLCVTRLVPVVRQLLSQFELKLVAELAIAPFYHAGFYLLISAMAGVFIFPAARNRIVELLAVVVKQWYVATFAVGGFIVLGQLMMDAGMTRQIADGIASLTLQNYAFAAPVVGALGGFLTASNAGSNALFMALQTTVASEIKLPVDVIAAAQNSAGSNVTLASPGRLVFAASVVGEAGSESKLLKQVAPVALAGVISASFVSYLLSR